MSLQTKILQLNQRILQENKQNELLLPKPKESQQQPEQKQEQQQEQKQKQKILREKRKRKWNSLIISHLPQYKPKLYQLNGAPSIIILRRLIPEGPTLYDKNNRIYYINDQILKTFNPQVFESIELTPFDILGVVKNQTTLDDFPEEGEVIQLTSYKTNVQNNFMVVQSGNNIPRESGGYTKRTTAFIVLRMLNLKL